MVIMPKTTTSQTPTPLIEFHSVALGYPHTPVLKNATFTINSGTFTCIVGPNGSGKSTLIKGILGLLKPTSGHLRLHLPQNEIGYLPQENKISQIFPATVEEVVLSGFLGKMNHRPFYHQTEKSKALAYLKQLDIAPLKNQSFSSLSGGQKQKVLLARALAATSSLLILDEPSNNLDHPSRQDFYQSLIRLHQTGLTILMITHDLDQEDLIGSHVLSISNGHTTLTTTKSFLRSYQP